LLNLEQLLLTHFTTEDQQIFVKHFQDYLKYGVDDTLFVVDFDDVYVWLGFTTKGNAKRLLTRKFQEGSDYIVTKSLILEDKRDIHVVVMKELITQQTCFPLRESNIKHHIALWSKQREVYAYIHFIQWSLYLFFHGLAHSIF
jgi:hypothetical protein